MQEAKKHREKQNEEKHLDKELLRFERSQAKTSKSRRKRVVKEPVSESEGWFANAKRWRRTFICLAFLVLIPVIVAFVWHSTVL